MREIRSSGSVGGAPQSNAASLPLSRAAQANESVPFAPYSDRYHVPWSVAGSRGAAAFPLTAPTSDLRPLTPDPRPLTPDP